MRREPHALALARPRIGFAQALAALRARQWAHFALIPFATVDRAALTSAAGLARGALAAVGASCALGYAYALNACADRASDVSCEKNPLVGVGDTPSSVRAVVAGSAAAALAIAALLGRHAVELTIASLLAGTIYSVGPRLKALPLLGLIVNTAIFAPLLGLALDRLPASTAAQAIAVVFVGLLVQSQLLHEIADAREDAAGGVRSTALALGPRRARAVAVAVAIPFAGVAAHASPNVFVAVASVTALLAGAAVALVRREAADVRALHRRVSMAAGAIVFASGLFA